MLIAHECERRGLALLELVGERAPRNAKELERPGLDYALERVAAGEAGDLVVAKLEHLSTSSTELGALIEWLSNRDACLVAADLERDTSLPCHRLSESQGRDNGPGGGGAMGELITLAEFRARRRAQRSPPRHRASPVFYFDLGCPYSYLALERVDRLLPGVRWRPTLTEDLRATDPWADEYARATAERRARELALPLIWPTTNARSPRHAMRVALHAIEHDRIAQFALAAARLAFCGGYDVDHPAVLAEAAAAASLDPGRVLRAAHNERLDGALEETGRRLLAAGATCLPAFGINRSLHCGEASIGLAVAALRRAGEPGVGAA